MKFLLLSIFFFAAAAPAAADDPAGQPAEILPPDAVVCSKILQEDDRLALAGALEVLVARACSVNPELCTPDSTNRDALAGLNAEIVTDAGFSPAAFDALFKDELKPNQFEFHEMQYILDTLLLKRISDRVCAGADSALDKVRRLTDWVFEQVSLSSERQHEQARAQPVYPLDIIERGFGLDFQISWALAALVQQQGLATALAYLPPADQDVLAPVLVLVFLEEGSVLVDPVRALVWQDADAHTPIGIREARERPKIVAKLHSQYCPVMAGSISKAVFRIPYHPLALLPKMKMLQAVLAEACAVRPLLFVDLVRAHNAFGHLFCRAEGLEGFTYLPELITFTLPGRTYSCSVWLLPLAQLFAMGIQDAPFYREARRMHLRREYDQASLAYRRQLALNQDTDMRPTLIYFLGLLEFDRGNYSQAAFVLQRYLDRNYTAWEDHIRFLLARAWHLQGEPEKSAQHMRHVRAVPRYERFVRP